MQLIICKKKKKKKRILNHSIVSFNRNTHKKDYVLVDWCKTYEQRFCGTSFPAAEVIYELHQCYRHCIEPESVQSLLCLTLCDSTDCSTPGFPVHNQLAELAQTHVHQVSDAIQPSHPLSSPSSPAFNISQNQGLFQWVSSSHQVAKVLKFQLQHQSFHWIFGTDLL